MCKWEDPGLVNSGVITVSRARRFLAFSSAIPSALVLSLCLSPHGWEIVPAAPGFWPHTHKSGLAIPHSFYRGGKPFPEVSEHIPLISPWPDLCPCT